MDTNHVMFCALIKDRKPCIVKWEQKQTSKFRQSPKQAEVFSWRWKLNTHATACGHTETYLQSRTSY